MKQGKKIFANEYIIITIFTILNLCSKEIAFFKQFSRFKYGGLVISGVTSLLWKSQKLLTIPALDTLQPVQLINQLE